ncbi:MAG: hypothetical protein AAB366_02140 [Patescibacteria group bacterium]
MDKLTKIKCFGCGIFIATAIGVESLPIICPKCHHVSAPHLPEQNYTVQYRQISTFAISGISDTATASILPQFDADTS